MTVPQLHCTDEKRREAVRLSTLNAIDSLEVLDHQAPAGSPRQRTLLVRLFRPVPTGASWQGADEVRVDGDARARPVRVDWALAAPAIPPALLSPAEQTFFGALAAADHVLVVRTREAGDASTYRFSIVDPADPSRPPSGFDPVLSSVDFSFKVECPTDYDCGPVPAPAQRAAPEPRIDYLAKDYGSFRRLMLDRMSLLVPAWKERHAADLGVALVELLAYAGDHLSYLQDAVATEGYLTTARKRVSVRRHARLLDYPMHEGCNARAWVAFEVTEDGVEISAPRKGVPGTPLLTRVEGAAGAVVAPESAERLIAASQPAVFEPVHDAALYRSHNRIRLYTWNDDDCCLPRGATRATLVDGGPEGRLRLRPGDVLVFEEARSSATGLTVDADPAKRHAVRLTKVSPAAEDSGTLARSVPSTALADPLTGAGIVEIAWDPEDALPFPLCLSAVIGGTEVADLSVARGNVVLADEGRTSPPQKATAPPPAEVVDPARPQLQRKGLVFTAPVDDAAPASRALQQEPRGAAPAVSLEGDGEEWTAQPDLLGSDAFARDFVVEVDDAGAAMLRFGDGVLGQAAPRAIRAVYRVGLGAGGNLGRDALAHVVTPDPGISRVWNPLPGAGGQDPEPIEEVKLYAPQAFRTQRRAVTDQDYADVAGKHPDVQKAMVTRRYTGSWNTLFLTVDRKGGRPVTQDFETELRDFIESYRLAGHDLEIEPPVTVPLEVRLKICVEPHHRRSDVLKALRERLGSGIRSDGTLGFFHPDRFTFGQPVYWSQLLSAAMEVAGVRWIDGDSPETRFQRFNRPPRDELKKGQITLERLEIARCDSDSSAPENGRVDFVLEGGL